ncbi:hypothetical protein [Pseudoprimorskyibacter insulae]|uniref:D-galactarate dehydratase n=1 Tax=Pseudoprimorskyibacter insulae TaxID=1695997 RepID=A0A2R8AX17_9RHOB|nr:hypothetical protein [Pseudoprimorskyibacter insulae]SPF80573.1 hypothetical protein PRI8871_02383 [Pseudoprimorskyibacter insulae]
MSVKVALGQQSGKGYRIIAWGGLKSYQLGMKWILSTVLFGTLAGCGGLVIKSRTGDAPVVAPAQDVVRPVARPAGLNAALKPPATARTAEQFDTTTKADRDAAAVKPVAGGEAALGLSIASLGDPTRPGFWIETPLVSEAGQGRVVYAPTGKSAQVTLLPIDGPKTAGSRLSLAAMRLIGAPLTGLPEVQVFRAE